MVTEGLPTDSDAEIMDKEWDGSPVAPFRDEAHTERRIGKLIPFRANRFHPVGGQENTFPKRGYEEEVEGAFPLAIEIIRDYEIKRPSSRKRRSA